MTKKCLHGAIYTKSSKTTKTYTLYWYRYQTLDVLEQNLLTSLNHFMKSQLEFSAPNTEQ
jgi:hypothetical protein